MRRILLLVCALIIAAMCLSGCGKKQTAQDGKTVEEVTSAAANAVRPALLQELLNQNY